MRLVNLGIPRPRIGLPMVRQDAGFVSARPNVQAAVDLVGVYQGIQAVITGLALASGQYDLSWCQGTAPAATLGTLGRTL